MTLPTHDSIVTETSAILRRLGVTAGVTRGDLAVRSPITGGEIARVQSHTAEQVRDVARKYFVPANTAVIEIHAVGDQAERSAEQKKTR